ncbi:MAG: pre-mRNA-splicing factor prp46 [Chaenotheca gracillima]|nr:MAG: pre-mRNA-splicing factor prp46 [Chaenotheca gracillima]
MGFRLPSFPYPPSQEGYWHPVTSTINWCEEDYYATIYSAEIVNTVTNLLFMYLAYKGFRSCQREKHDLIFNIGFVGYFLVGAGSLMFHATLKYPWQLVDELSMIYTTCLMCYATFSFSKTPRFATFLAIALIGLAIFITLYYHYLQDPEFHQNAYAILTAVVLFRSMYTMEVELRPSRRPKKSSSTNGSAKGSLEKVSSVSDREDEQTLRSMWLLVACGLSIFLGGFGIWTLDNTYCSQLRQWRQQVGLPWGLLLEGHGWWHLMTGTGAYFYLTWGIWLRHCLSGRQDEYSLKWPSMWTSLPEIVRTDQSSTQDSKRSNGRTSTKKNH